MATIQLTTAGFKEKVFNYETEKDWKYQGTLPAIIDFYADWCAPCKKMEPYLSKIAAEMPEKVKIVRVNADDNTELCKAMNVSALPVLKLYRNNEIIWESLGFVEEAEVRKQLLK